MFEINHIHKGDCIELMSKMPSECIDLIFADPPYNLQLNGELTRPNQTIVDAVNDEWDKFDSMDDYDTFSRAWLTECYRIMKPNASFWVIGTYHNIFRIGSIMQNLGFWILNDIVWIKTNPMPNFKGTRFNNAHETLIWACKDKTAKVTFNYHSMKIMNDDHQMRSDWVIPICSGTERLRGSDGKKIHSTQKPVELLFRVILSTSKPGDLVLDPFMGSGTTGAVAKRLGRNFLGFEKDETYIEHANRRISHVVKLPDHIVSIKEFNKKPNVSFGNLIEKGLIKIGSELVSKDGKHRALVYADGSIEAEGIFGSIHKVSAKLINRENNNGWSYWYYETNGIKQLIDEYRYIYEEKYLKHAD